MTPSMTSSMSEMCLAILPGAALVLLALVLLRRLPAHPVLPTLRRRMDQRPKPAGALPHLTPSLSTLCILRT